MATTVNTDVFTSNFKSRPEYSAILNITNQSPYLVSMLNEMHANGQKIEVGQAGKGTFFSPLKNQVDVDPTWISQYSTQTKHLKQLVSVIGHEAGHAIRPDGHSRPVSNPWQDGANGLFGEGVAITSEYIVAKQLNGQMWSDPSGARIRGALDQLANNTGVNLSTRTTADSSANLSAFDQGAHQQGANYYGGLNPSTALNLKYDEYYKEYRALANVIGSDVNKIDWGRVQSGNVLLNINSDHSYSVQGINVPMIDGTKMQLSAQLSSSSHIVGTPIKQITPIANEQGDPASLQQPVNQDVQHRSLASNSDYKTEVLTKTNVAVNGLCNEKGYPNHGGRDNMACHLASDLITQGSKGVGTFQAALGIDGKTISVREQISEFKDITVSADSNVIVNIPKEQSLAKIAAYESPVIVQADPSPIQQVSRGL